MQVTATQSAQNVIIVATFDGTPSESNPIEFTKIPGNALSFAEAKKVTTYPSSAIVHQVASNSGTVTGDDRTIQYSINPEGQGVTIGSSSGVIVISWDSDPVNDYTITAELAEDEKYTRTTATYSLTVE